MNDNQDLKKKSEDQILSNKGDASIDCRFYEKKYPEPDDLVVVRIILLINYNSIIDLDNEMISIYFLNLTLIRHSYIGPSEKYR